MTGHMPDPDRGDYRDAAFGAFQTPASMHKYPVRDEFGGLVTPRWRPMYLVPTVVCALMGAWAIFTPLPAVLAVGLGVRARRRGVRGARGATVFAVACVGVGVWMMLTVWGY